MSVNSRRSDGPMPLENGFLNCVTVSERRTHEAQDEGQLHSFRLWREYAGCADSASAGDIRRRGGTSGAGMRCERARDGRNARMCEIRYLERRRVLCAGGFSQGRSFVRRRYRYQLPECVANSTRAIDVQECGRFERLIGQMRTKS